MRQEIGDPPAKLDETEFVALLVNSRGAKFDVQVAESDLERLHKLLPEATNPLLVNMGPSLQNKYFIRRGGLTLITVEQVGKINGEIINVVHNRRLWERMPWWPHEFIEEKESNELDLPPSDESEYEYEYEEEEDGSYGDNSQAAVN